LNAIIPLLEDAGAEFRSQHFGDLSGAVGPVPFAAVLSDSFFFHMTKSRIERRRYL
jgi:hypothetical protein